MFPSFTEIPFTYTLILLVITTSICGFYNRSFTNSLVFHPYEVYRLNRIHTIFSSALLHKSWSHLLFNIYFFFIMGKDLEYIILADHYTFWSAKSIYILLLVFTIGLPNLFIGWKQRNHVLFTSMGFSGAVYGFTAFSIIYFPLQQVKETHKLIPLRYGYQFALCLLCVVTLSMFIFKKSTVNHVLHLCSATLGLLIAFFCRPELVYELASHFSS